MLGHVEEIIVGQKYLVEQRPESVGARNANKQHEDSFNAKEEPIAVQKARLPHAQTPHDASRERNDERIGIHNGRVRVNPGRVVSAKENRGDPGVNETGDHGKEGKSQHHEKGFFA